MTHWINIGPLIIIILGCILFLVSNRKSIVLSSAVLIMISGFILDLQFASITSALVRLVASLSALMAIYLSMRETQTDFQPIPRNAAIFRIIAYIMFASLAILVVNKVSIFLKTPVEVTLGGLLSLFCGILLLGISTSPSKVIVGLLIFFIGFATIYGIIESSLLVTGLISAILLLLGGLGTYFVIREVTIEKE